MHCDAHRLEPADRFFRFRPDDVGQGQRPGGPAVEQDEDDGLALGRKPPDPLVPDLDVPLPQVSRAYDLDVPAVDLSFGALARVWP